MFHEMYEAGVAFAETRMNALAQRFMTGKDLNAEDKKYAAGAVALGAGNFVKNLGYAGALVTVVLAGAAVFNPVSATVMGLFGLLAGAGVSGAAICFGRGMEEGGERNSGLRATSKAMQAGLWRGLRDDIRKWVNPKSARVDFDAVNDREAAKKLEAVPAPKPQPPQPRR